MENKLLKYQRSPEHIISLVQQGGLLPRRSSHLLAAALAQVETKEPFPELLYRARDFFANKAVFVPEGLERIPAPWLAQLPAVLWSTRKPHWSHLPYMIRSADFSRGVLCMTFPQELPCPEERMTAWDLVRVEVNCCLFPNLWAPLPARLEKKIWDTRPDLRAELFTVLG